MSKGYFDDYLRVTLQANGPVGEAMAERWQADSAAAREHERRWIAHLRARHGVVAVHPDDGWVNRDTGELRLIYPDFRERQPVLGDAIALGWAAQNDYRIVRVTGIIAGILAGPSFRFVDEGPAEPLPREAAAA
jgi:hypothetical protein